MKQLDHYETIAKMPNKTTDCVIYAYGVTCDNLGLILRSADVFGIAAVYYHKMRGDINDGRLKKLSRNSNVPVVCVDNFDALSDMKAGGYTVLALEITDASVPLSQVRFGKKTCLVVGNEQHGVPDEILNIADSSCHIEMTGGRISSLNVAVATSIAAYAMSQTV